MSLESAGSAVVLYPYRLKIGTKGHNNKDHFNVINEEQYLLFNCQRHPKKQAEEHYHSIFYAPNCQSGEEEHRRRTCIEINIREVLLQDLKVCMSRS